MLIFFHSCVLVHFASSNMWDKDNVTWTTAPESFHMFVYYPSSSALWSFLDTIHTHRHFYLVLFTFHSLNTLQDCYPSNMDLFINPRPHDTQPKMMTECVNPGGDGLDMKKYQSFVTYRAGKSQRRITYWLVHRTMRRRNLQWNTTVVVYMV